MRQNTRNGRDEQNHLRDKPKRKPPARGSARGGLGKITQVWRPELASVSPAIVIPPLPKIKSKKRICANRSSLPADTALLETEEQQMTSDSIAQTGGTFRHIATTFTGTPPKTRRAVDPVRRGSRRAGTCEAGFWGKTSRQDVQKILMAARRYELTHKQPGRRNGPLGGVALELLSLFANLVSFRTGRLEPSLNWICDKLRRSRDAVVRGLNALREHGFLEWLRRFEPTKHDGRGPPKSARSAMPIASAHQSEPWRFWADGQAALPCRMTMPLHVITGGALRPIMWPRSILAASLPSNLVTRHSGRARGSDGPKALGLTRVCQAD